MQIKKNLNDDDILAVYALVGVEALKTTTTASSACRLSSIALIRTVRTPTIHMDERRRELTFRFRFRQFSQATGTRFTSRVRSWLSMFLADYRL
jgi:hypothetical protein